MSPSSRLAALLREGAAIADRSATLSLVDDEGRELRRPLGDDFRISARVVELAHGSRATQPAEPAQVDGFLASLAAASARLAAAFDPAALARAAIARGAKMLSDMGDATPDSSVPESAPASAPVAQPSSLSTAAGEVGSTPCPSASPAAALFNYDPPADAHPGCFQGANRHRPRRGVGDVAHTAGRRLVSELARPPPPLIGQRC